MGPWHCGPSSQLQRVPWGALGCPKGRGTSKYPAATLGGMLVLAGRLGEAARRALGEEAAWTEQMLIYVYLQTTDWLCRTLGYLAGSKVTLPKLRRNVNGEGLLQLLVRGGKMLPPFHSSEGEMLAAAPWLLEQILI